ncbi:MAG: FAD-dependent oxidoreductase [Rikenellaceae bacterium]|nr:FAD-dependent oxidoreductase [Rikenellaceae bacterium]
MKRLLIALCCLCALACTRTEERYDVIVVGGGTSGAAAGIQSARMGAKTLIAEEFEWLGGMLTSAGVSATDGCYKLRGGFWAEFRDSLESRYGGTEALKTGWVSNVMFEPSVGAAIFDNIAAACPQLTVWRRTTFKNAEWEDGKWRVMLRRDGAEITVWAKVLIDATELGDVAAALGVACDVGMDSRYATGEEIASEQANAVIQDLTYVMILRDYGINMTIDRPEGYDRSLYLCCCDSPSCIAPKEKGRLWSREKMITYGRLPGGRYMINWPIEGNDFYADMTNVSPFEREALAEKAKMHSLGFLYFMQTELGFSTYGLADDEFPTDDMLPFIPYHRESRRIHGAVRMTLGHITDPYCQPQPLYRTCIAVGDYPVDQHHMRYPKWSELPDLYFHPVPSYGVPMGVMLPINCEGLIVAEKSISVTNLVNGSTRLQPVVLQLGQAAGIMAALSVQHDRPVSRTCVREVQREILERGGYLLPYLDVEPSHPHFKAMQRIGATGIIKGRGANAGWENQTWFDADKPFPCALLAEGLRELYPEAVSNVPGNVTWNKLVALLSLCNSSVRQRSEGLTCASLDMADVRSGRELNRGECAVLIDALLAPFDHEVTIEGKYEIR